MKFLIVSPPALLPESTGYLAEQMAIHLRSEGHQVDTLSTPGGNGDFVAPLRGGYNLLKITHYKKYYDKILLHFRSHFYFEPYENAGIFNRLWMFSAKNSLPRIK